MVSSSLVRSRAIAILLPLLQNVHGTGSLVSFIENAHIAILASASKLSFWAAWTVMNNCRSQFGWQSAQLKESAISRVVERQVTPDLPDHVVLVPPLLVPPWLVPPLLVPPLLVPPLLVPPLLVPPWLVPPLLVPPLLVPPSRLLVPPLLFSGDGSAAGSSSGAGTDGATSTASRLLFSGLPSEVSSSPAVVVKKISGFFSCRPPYCQADASSLVFSSTGGTQTRMFIKQYSLQYFLILTEYIQNLNKNAHSRAD